MKSVPDRAPCFWPGDVIGSRYWVDHVLGTGATASVYAAIDRLSAETVAVKVFHAALATDPGTERAFWREIEVSSLVSSPHLPRVLEWRMPGATDAYLVLEHVDGPSVRDVLRDRALGIPSVVDLGLQVLAALEMAAGLATVRRRHRLDHGARAWADLDDAAAPDGGDEADRTTQPSVVVPLGSTRPSRPGPR